jgi:hypothetical protein
MFMLAGEVARLPVSIATSPNIKKKKNSIRAFDPVRVATGC